MAIEQKSAKMRGGGSHQKANFFAGLVGMNDRLADVVSAHAVLRHANKGSVLVRMGDSIPAVFFLVSGCIQTYTSDENGKETTDCLQAAEGSVVVPSAELDEPSPSFVVAIKESTLYSLDMSFVQWLIRSDTDAMRFYNNKLREAWRERRDIQYAVLNKSATKRYEWFREAYPQVEEDVPSCYIASFLGMDVTTLSRARSAYKQREG